MLVTKHGVGMNYDGGNRRDGSLFYLSKFKHGQIY